MADTYANFFIGVGLGVGIGLLFAPQSGEATRERLKEKADAGKDYLKRRSYELRDSANDMFERGKEVIGRGKDTALQGVEFAKETYRDNLRQPTSTTWRWDRTLVGVGTLAPVFKYF
jgi:gas vesicle protein